MLRGSALAGIGILGLLAVAKPAPVQAAAITYTETAIATGRFGSLTGYFTNAVVTITLTSDTATVNGPAGSHQTNVGVTTISVSGMGTGTFMDPTSVSENPSSYPIAGINDLFRSTIILATASPSFAAYDLKTSIGPISGLAYYQPGFVYSTTSGLFELDSVATSTFTAVTAPEPTSCVLMCTALLAAAARRRLQSEVEAA